MVQAEYLILGSGISGSLLARHLFERGKNVHVIEKSRQVGGRIASKRLGKSEDTIQNFSSGINSFTAKDILSSPWFEAIIDEKLIEWSDDDNVFYLQTPATNIIQFLLRGIPLSVRENISTIQTSNSKWDLITDKGHLFRGSTLILATPAPQALPLIGNLVPGDILEKLSQASYEKSLTFWGECDLEGAEKIKKNFSHLFRSFDFKTRKPITTIMVELNHELCSQYYDMSLEEMTAEIANLFSEVKLGNCGIEKWPHARVKKTLPENYIQFSGRPLGFVVGDFLGSSEKSDFERAWLSVEALAKTLKEF
ncbi:MAG: NAD(P)-binding protein [Pseudobdellovibrionaceae bacterium]